MNSEVSIAARNPSKNSILWLSAVLALVALAGAWSSTAFWDALSPVTNKRELYQLAGEYKVDPLLLASIVRTESGFNPFASSKKGALGLMQLVPETAQQLAAE